MGVTIYLEASMFMSRLRRPSPALVIALIALTVALGGTAAAAVTSVPLTTMSGTKLVKQLVPTLGSKYAKTADSASTVSGQTVTRIFATAAEGQQKKVYSKRGLTLFLFCEGPSLAEVIANGIAANGDLVVQGNGQYGTFESHTLGTGSPSNVISFGSYGTGVAEYHTPDGHVVSLTYGFEDKAAPAGSVAACTFWGDSISG